MNIKIILIASLMLAGCAVTQQVAENAGVPDTVIDGGEVIVSAGCELRRLHNAASFNAGDAVDLICGLSGKPTSISIENDPEVDRACFATRNVDASVEWNEVCGQRDLGKFQ